MNSLNFSSWISAYQFSDIYIQANKIINWDIALSEWKTIFTALTVFHRYAEFHNIILPADIKYAIDILSESFEIPPVITYESLILLNDLDNDPVLFSQEHWEAELLFYKTHQDIEYYFFQIHTLIKNAYLDNCYDINIWNIQKALSKIIESLYSLMKDMDTLSFDALRPYWNLAEYSQKDEFDNSYPWPSWAYTCWFVYLDLVLWIKSVDIDSYSMDDRMLPSIPWSPYITRYDLDHLRWNIKQKWVLRDLFPWKISEIDVLKKMVLKFRLWHKQAARKYVWDENLERPWTGWAKNARMFLEQHIEDTKTHIQNNLTSNKI